MTARTAFLMAERRDHGKPEPARDPNRFHHAAALIKQMDRDELYHLGQLVLERLTSLQKKQPKGR